MKIIYYYFTQFKAGGVDFQKNFVKQFLEILFGLNNYSFFRKNMRISTKEDTLSIWKNVDDVQNCSTELDMYSYKLNWTIKRFILISKSLSYIESEKFPTIDKDNYQWCLRLELTELNQESEENFKFSLKQTNGSKRKIYTKLSIFNSLKKEANYMTILPMYDTEVEFEISSSALYEKLIKNGIIPDDVNIFCEVIIFSEKTHKLPKTLINYDSINQLKPQIEKLTDDEKSNDDFKDVTFYIEENEYKAHKLILSLRSPVFAAMFNNKTEKQSTIRIDDIRGEIFQKMLRSIYTDNVNDLEESAFELYYAAEKYQLDYLKIMCINKLYQNLSSETVLKILEFADAYSISKLKDAALNYLALNLSEISESNDFTELLENRTNLSQDIFKILRSMDKMHLSIGEEKDNNSL